MNECRVTFQSQGHPWNQIFPEPKFYLTPALKLKNKNLRWGSYLLLMRRCVVLMGLLAFPLWWLEWYFLCVISHSSFAQDFTVKSSGCFAQHVPSIPHFPLHGTLGIENKPLLVMERIEIVCCISCAVDGVPCWKPWRLNIGRCSNKDWASVPITGHPVQWGFEHCSGRWRRKWQLTPVNPRDGVA